MKKKYAKDQLQEAIKSINNVGCFQVVARHLTKQLQTIFKNDLIYICNRGYY